MAIDLSASLRNEVARRAGYRCEYCLIREEDGGFRLQVDHIISRKHGGSSTADNLAFACILCNRHKGTDIASIHPETGEVVPLFHPRNDSWSDHFRIAGQHIEPLSSIGSVTMRLLRLNSPERLAERRLLQERGGYPFS